MSEWLADIGGNRGVLHGENGIAREHVPVSEMRRVLLGGFPACGHIERGLRVDVA